MRDIIAGVIETAPKFCWQNLPSVSLTWGWIFSITLISAIAYAAYKANELFKGVHQ